MLLNILTFVYVACDLLAITSGTAVLLGLLTGRLSDRHTVLFLQSALATSVTGLLFPFNHHLLPTHKISMLAVYISGLAILAWRHFHLAGVWRFIFAFSLTLVLYLNVLVAIAQVFKFWPPLEGRSSAQSQPLSSILQLAVLLPFVAFGILAAIRFRNQSPRWISAVQKRSPDA